MRVEGRNKTIVRKEEKYMKNSHDRKSLVKPRLDTTKSFKVFGQTRFKGVSCMASSRFMTNSFSLIVSAFLKQKK